MDKNQYSARGFDPKSDFRYGKVYHDPLTVKDCLTYPEYDERVLSRSPKKTQQKVDFIQTNKAAIAAGCCTSRDFREYREKTVVYVKQEENWKHEEEVIRQTKVKEMVHGVKTAPVSEIHLCFNYPVDEVQTRSIKPKKKKVSLAHASRSTRASRAHANKPPPPPTEAETFKLKRFTSINRCAIQDHW